MNNKTKLNIAVCTILTILLMCFASSTLATDYLDVPGTDCKARDPSQESQLRYNTHGELVNQGNSNVMVVCGFQLRDNSATDYYAAYVYGNSISYDKYVEGRLWVAHSRGMDRWYSWNRVYAGAGQSYRLRLNDVWSLSNATGFDIVTIDVLLPPSISVTALRLFIHND